jgi:hypothetical protein
LYRAARLAHRKGLEPDDGAVLGVYYGLVCAQITPHRTRQKPPRCYSNYSRSALCSNEIHLRLEMHLAFFVFAVVDSNAVMLESIVNAQ